MNVQAVAQDLNIARAPQPQSLTQADGAPAAKATAAQFITLAIGDDHYAIDIMAVREIKNWSPIRHLPEQPDYVRGICSLRGAFIPIVDLRCRFGEGRTEATPLHVFIIVQIGLRQVGLLADRVSDIVDIARADIKPVPEVAETRGLGFLSGLATVDGATVGLIELDRILDHPAEATASQTPEPSIA